MFVKQILIYFPLLLILFLVQSFFWVPTYDEQGRGSPKRLVKYLDGSSGDASLLNPVLSADSASSVIEGKVYDGLIDLDENLRLRPRLATSWVEYEEATLAFDVSLAGSLGPGVDTPRDFARAILQALRPQRDWYSNIKKVDILPAKKVSTKILLPAEAGEEGDNALKVNVPYRLNMPARVKFILKKVDQDFFKPIEKLLGKRYFDAFPYKKYIHANDPRRQNLLASHYQEILPITVHHPVVVFTLREGVRFHDGHEFDSGDVLFTYHSLMNPKNASPRTSDYEPVESVEPLGPGKIRITYKRLFSPAINSWAMGILPEHLLNEARLKEEAAKRGLDWEKFSLRDSEFNRHPIGTGAFVFKEWKSDELIRLTRNPDYWEGLPEYEEFVMRIIPDTLTREMEFYAGPICKSTQGFGDGGGCGQNHSVCSLW